MKVYYVYILTNPGKSVLYVGVTNNLRRRLDEHRANKGTNKSFTGRYYCHKLIYFEEFRDIRYAIDREKELKGWTRTRKEELIATMNPKWHTLNMNFYF
ncbi:MAG: GIY-YIG nuclease family protein [Chitinophagales bacterium]